MNRYEELAALLPVLDPVFYTRMDSAQHEFVLLDTGTPDPGVIPHPVTDKTQFEAFENHVHIFDRRIRKEDYDKARRIGTAIAENLYHRLTARFPEKAFMVYLTINAQGAIVRFHQIWENEPPYFDETAQYDAEIIAFHK